MTGGTKNEETLYGQTQETVKINQKKTVQLNIPN